jgi:hypothetical protein
VTVAVHMWLKKQPRSTCNCRKNAIAQRHEPKRRIAHSTPQCGAHARFPGHGSMRRGVKCVPPCSTLILPSHCYSIRPQKIGPSVELTLFSLNRQQLDRVILKPSPCRPLTHPFPFGSTTNPFTPPPPSQSSKLPPAKPSTTPVQHLPPMPRTPLPHPGLPSNPGATPLTCNAATSSFA